MRNESDLKMCERHIRRCAELIVRQRHLVDHFADGTDDRWHAEELLKQLEWALEIHQTHLGELLVYERQLGRAPIAWLVDDSGDPPLP